MLNSEITMFLEDSKLFGGILDVEGINEEFENQDYDYINKLIRNIEENKLNY